MWLGRRRVEDFSSIGGFVRMMSHILDWEGEVIEWRADLVDIRVCDVGARIGAEFSVI